MEPNKIPSASTVPGQRGSHVPKEEEKRRRMSRGRRSLVQMGLERPSPTTTIAHLSHSILRNTAIDRVALLTKRRDNIVSYIARLKLEKEDWEERMNRQRLLLMEAERDSGRPLECLNMRRRSTIDSTPTPQYILNRTLRSFYKQCEGHSDQKYLDRLLGEVEAMKNSIKVSKSKAQAYISILNAEPRSEFLAHKKWWEELRDKQDRRIQLLKKKLANLECREVSLEENSIIASI